MIICLPIRDRTPASYFVALLSRFEDASPVVRFELHTLDSHNQLHRQPWFHLADLPTLSHVVLEAHSQIRERLRSTAPSRVHRTAPSSTAMESTHD